MPLDLVPRLSLSCGSSDIVAPGVALRRLLLHSSFDFFHGSNFIPKRATRHRSVEEGTLPPISKPRRRHQHQEQETALQLCVQASECKWTMALVWGPTSDRRSRKKVTKTQKKIYFRPDLQSRWTLQVRWPFGLEIPLDSNHDPSLQRRKAKRWPISPVLTPAARCGECRFKLLKLLKFKLLNCHLVSSVQQRINVLPTVSVFVFFLLG